MQYSSAAVLIGLLSGLLWGLNSACISWAGDQIALVGAAAFLPLVLAALNDSAAAVTLLIAGGLKGQFSASWKFFFSKGGVRILLAALLGGPFGQTMYFCGIWFAGSATALLFTALYPIFGCLFAKLFLKQHLTLRMWTGVAFAVFGGMLTAGSFSFDAEGTVLFGILCSLCAALAWGGEIVLAVSGMAYIPPDAAVRLREVISGSVLLLIVALFPPAHDAAVLVISASSSWGAIGGAGILGGISYLFWYMANRALGCAKGTVLNSTYVVWGVLLAASLGLDSLTFEMIVGAVAVLIGVFLVNEPLHSSD